MAAILPLSAEATLLCVEKVHCCPHLSEGLRAVLRWSSSASLVGWAGHRLQAAVILCKKNAWEDMSGVWQTGWSVTAEWGKRVQTEGQKIWRWKHPFPLLVWKIVPPSGRLRREKEREPTKIAIIRELELPLDCLNSPSCWMVVSLLLLSQASFCPQLL